MKRVKRPPQKSFFIKYKSVCTIFVKCIFYVDYPLFRRTALSFSCWHSIEWNTLHNRWNDCRTRKRHWKKENQHNQTTSTNEKSSLCMTAWAFNENSSLILILNLRSYSAHHSIHNYYIFPPSNLFIYKIVFFFSIWWTS